MHHPSPYMECGVLFFWWRLFWMTAIFHSGGKIFGHNGKRHFFRPPGGSRYILQTLENGFLRCISIYVFSMETDNMGYHGTWEVDSPTWHHTPQVP